ncbi:hypothetical protein HDU97_001063 [Phlyctochytrium planicorne]|nr:hypothetical protein HDU97_001063 [Phlyctochytrium planicorne]
MQQEPRGKPIAIPIGEDERIHPMQLARGGMVGALPPDVEMHAVNSPYWKMSAKERQTKYPTNSKPSFNMPASTSNSSSSPASVLESNSIPSGAYPRPVYNGVIMGSSSTVLNRTNGTAGTASMVTALMETISNENKLEAVEAPEDLVVDLYQHQLEGLAWLKKQESGLKCAILADDMGLGKTIQTIALILSTKKVEGRKTTLVVTTLSLLRQWETEIKTKTKDGSLNVYVYHGPSRTRDVETLETFDVVLTTYTTIASDFQAEGAKNGPLLNIKFLRVVLDEAQLIKNYKSKTANACFNLRSRYRICLTGTPIQNNIEELYSLFRFLRMDPLDDLKTFKRTFANRISNSDLALERIRTVFRTVLLRRTKLEQNDDADRPQLPPKNTSLLYLEFSEQERNSYNELMDKSRQKYQELLASCNHPYLAEDPTLEDEDELDGLISSISTMAIDASPAPSKKAPNKAVEKLKKSWASSAKITKMLELLEEGKAKSSGDKWIIFSQFTKMMDILELAMDREEIKYVRYDGSMTSKARDICLQNFREDESVQVCLISLQCG